MLQVKVKNDIGMFWLIVNGTTSETFPLEIGRFKREKKSGETIIHTSCKRIAKMANLSQYCTPLEIVYSLKFNRGLF